MSAITSLFKPVKAAFLSIIILALSCSNPPAEIIEDGMIPAPQNVGASPSDADTTSSGLSSKVLKKGTGGNHPTPADLVTVNYVGWTKNGQMFDASEKRGGPSTLLLSETLPGWVEGVTKMTIGEERRFWIPENLAYQGQPGRPSGSLVFDIELLRFGPSPSTPSDVAEPPADAEFSESGLAWKVLQNGTGTIHPAESSNVTAHYSGWTTDGKMFDSSVARGEPLIFRVDGVIAGWIEGLQLMVEGEQRRLWIPEKLAYKGREGAPKGMLVFDVELISVNTKSP
jgi:peptidylprolyl isomerase